MFLKKTAVALAVTSAIGLGIATEAQANTVGLTGVWNGTYLFNMTSPGGGPVGGSGTEQAWTWDFDAGTVSITNTTTFYGSVWTAHDVTFTDNGANYGSTTSTGPANMFFDWSSSTNLPVAEQWEVTATGNALGDTANVSALSALILASSSAFPGFHPAFDGTLTKVSASVVPIPAAGWLLGSALLGIAGVGRRRKRQA